MKRLRLSKWQLLGENEMDRWLDGWMEIKLWYLGAVSYRRGCQPTAWVAEEMLTKPALAGSCRPLSLMHCFLTHRFLHQISCLKKSLNYLELQKIVDDSGFVAMFHFHFFSFLPLFPRLLAQLFWLSLSLPSHSVISFLCLVSFPPSLLPHLFPSQLLSFLSFSVLSLSSPSISLSTGVSGRLCRVET